MDPVIIGDVSLQVSVDSTDAETMNQEVGATARVTIPYAPIGLTIAPVGPDIKLSAIGFQLSARLAAVVGTPALTNSNSGPPGWLLFDVSVEFSQAFGHGLLATAAEKL